MVDMADLKSADRNIVRVRIPSLAPLSYLIRSGDVKTYLDFAENDYQFLCASRKAQIHGNAICVLCHAACERYLKHILDYYSKDAIHLEVFRTSSLNALLKLLKKYVPENLFTTL